MGKWKEGLWEVGCVRVGDVCKRDGSGVKTRVPTDLDPKRRHRESEGGKNLGERQKLDNLKSGSEIRDVVELIKICFPG